MAEDRIGYEKMTRDALRDVVRMALSKAAGPDGLPGGHHFYITFSTKAAGVELGERLRETYTDQMTIVLEHQFWELEPFHDRFCVLLKFAGVPHRIVVPYTAITRFVDPSVGFGLNFEAEEPGELHGAGQASASASRQGAGQRPAPGGQDVAAPPAGGAVVALDAFRKK